MSEMHCPSCQAGPFVNEITYCVECGEVLASDALLNGRYKLCSRIGKGGVGHVYLAEDQKIYGHVCAVKRIPLKLLDQNYGPQQAEREAKMLVQVLNHGILGVPDIYDTFTLDDCVFVVMKYIEGEALDVWVQNNNPPWAVITDRVLQTAKVVSYLHSLTPPIAHSDIKPGNILLDARGNIWLVDFGFAHSEMEVDDPSFIPGFTRSYAPWEQFGLGRPSQPADVYALAMTLYYLLVGPETFKQRKSAAINSFKPVDGVCAEDEFMPEWSAELKPLLISATRAQPEDRISIVDLINQLEAALPGIKPQPLKLSGDRELNIPLEFVPLADQDWNYACKLLRDGTYASWIRKVHFLDNLAGAIDKLIADAPVIDQGLEDVLHLLNTDLPQPELVCAAKKVNAVVRGMEPQELTLTLGNATRGYLPIKFSADQKWITKIDPQADSLIGVSEKVIRIQFDPDQLPFMRGINRAVLSAQGGADQKLSIPIEVQFPIHLRVWIQILRPLAGWLRPISGIVSSLAFSILLAFPALEKIFSAPLSDRLIGFAALPILAGLGAEIGGWLGVGRIVRTAWSKVLPAPYPIYIVLYMIVGIVYLLNRFGQFGNYVPHVLMWGMLVLNLGLVFGTIQPHKRVTAERFEPIRFRITGLIASGIVILLMSYFAPPMDQLAALWMW